MTGEKVMERYESKVVAEELCTLFVAIARCEASNSNCAGSNNIFSSQKTKHLPVGR